MYYLHFCSIFVLGLKMQARGRGFCWPDVFSLPLIVFLRSVIFFRLESQRCAVVACAVVACAVMVCAAYAGKATD